MDRAERREVVGLWSKEVKVTVEGDQFQLRRGGVGVAYSGKELRRIATHVSERTNQTIDFALHQVARVLEKEPKKGSLVCRGTTLRARPRPFGRILQLGE